MPGLRVLFTRGSDSAALLLCFECEMLSLAPPGEIRWEFFDPASRKLVDLAKDAFPHDPEILGLKLERE